MSIFKVIPKKDDGVETLLDRLTYIKRVNATTSRYIEGINVSSTYAYPQMMQVKKEYDQTTGKAYFHYMLDFAPEDYEHLDNYTLHKIGYETASYISCFYGIYQVVMSIHFDTAPHIHYIVNNIDLMTGARFDLPLRRLSKMKKGISEILSHYGITAIEQSPYYDDMLYDSFDSV